MTPHLLQKSGVGDPDALTAAGLTPLIALPSVGAGVQDHPAIGMIFQGERNPRRTTGAVQNPNHRDAPPPKRTRA